MIYNITNFIFKQKLHIFSATWVSANKERTGNIKKAILGIFPRLSANYTAWQTKIFNCIPTIILCPKLNNASWQQQKYAAAR